MSLSDNLDGDWGALLAKTTVSTKAFCSTFLPDYFYRHFDPAYEEIFRLIDDPTIQKVAIAAPRGIGKTTINTVGIPARRICYRQSRFIVQVSSTAKKAEMDASSLRNALSTSPLVTDTFGDIKAQSDTWATENFKALDTFIMPRGAGQQIRGLNHHGRRPDFIIVDDLENSEDVLNENSREKLEHWFDSDLCNSIDRADKTWKIIVVGTILHEASLLQKLLKDPEWASVRLSICTPELVTNFPSIMSNEEVEKLYRSHADKGKADIFAREYQNQPISTQDAVFKPDLFQYYEPADILDNHNIEYVVIVDPAKTAKIASADSSIITVGIDRVAHKIYFHDCVAEKLHPDEIYHEAIRQAQAYGCRKIGIEVTSLHEFITQPFTNELKKNRVYAQLIELKARDKKEMRVAQLAPFYRQGYIYHNVRVAQKLEHQLMAFPRSELWDVMDAFAYIIEMMELSEEYFFADEVPGEDEFAELIDDEPLEDWRI